MNPMPPSAPMPTRIASSHALGQRTDPQPEPEQAEAGDSHDLADHQAHDDAVRHRRRRSAFDSDRDVKSTARVGEREQRDDQEAAPRVQPVLEPLDDRHRLSGDDDRLLRGLDGRQVEERVDVDHVDLAEGPGRCEQSEDDTRDRGV